MARVLLWLGALPFAGALLVHALAFRRDVGGNFWDAALLVSVLVGGLVAWLAAQSGYGTRDALYWGLGAAAATLAWIWVPFIVFFTTCDQCLQ